MELDNPIPADVPPIGQVLEQSTIRKYLSPSDPASNPEAMKRFEEEDAARELAEKTRLRNNIWAALLESRGPRYRKAAFANYIATSPAQIAAKTAVEEYAANAKERIEAGQSVVFIGPAGTGKDHLIMAMAHEAIGALKSLIWVNGSDLWLAFREAIDKKSNGETPRYWPRYDDRGEYFDASLPASEGGIIRKLREVDVLAISDPVAPGCSLTDWQADKLLAITDYRYSNLMPTWITLNASSRQEAESRIGGPTVDRWAHDALVVVCDWPSYRRKEPDKAQND